MLNIFRSSLKASFVSLLLAIGVVNLGAISISLTHAQSTGAAHGKATGIPEKKPDGTREGLKPAQQQILAPLESDWDYMLPESRKKWIQVANLYPKMSQLDQQRLQSRMASWSNLSQRDRRLARENYLSSLKFPAEKKSEAWSAYQKLSDEQKKKLAEAEVKKKPSAASAPTLQQHPIIQKSNLAPTIPAPSSISQESSGASGVSNADSSSSSSQ